MKLTYKRLKPALVNLGFFFMASSVLTYILSYHSPTKDMAAISFAFVLGVVFLVSGYIK